MLGGGRAHSCSLFTRRLFKKIAIKKSVVVAARSKAGARAHRSRYSGEKTKRGKWERARACGGKIGGRAAAARSRPSARARSFWASRRLVLSRPLAQEEARGAMPYDMASAGRSALSVGTSPTLSSLPCACRASRARLAPRRPLRSRRRRPPPTFPSGSTTLQRAAGFASCLQYI